MLIESSNLRQLGKLIEQERKRQKLTREQAAAICQVSPSFIRDAEADPAKCSLGKLSSLCEGLGLKLHLIGLENDSPVSPFPVVGSAWKKTGGARATLPPIGSALRTSDVAKSGLPQLGRAVAVAAEHHTEPKKK